MHKEYSPNVENKLFVLNQGGGLYQKPEIQKLFGLFNYNVCPTDLDASYQNEPVEQAHCMVATSICAILFGSSLLVKF